MAQKNEDPEVVVVEDDASSKAGKSTLQAKDKVGTKNTGGHTNEFPECVILGVYDGKYVRWSGRGSGVIVKNNRFVLTASHNIDSHILSDPLTNYVIGINLPKPKSDKSCISSKNFRVFFVDKRARLKYSSDGELVLFKLERRVPRAVEMPIIAEKSDFKLLKKEVEIVGYGSNSTEAVLGTGCKRKAILKEIISEYTYANKPNELVDKEEELGFDKDTQFAAGGKSAICEGDSGGPVYFTETGLNKKRKLIGIILEDTLTDVVKMETENVSSTLNAPKIICGSGAVISRIEVIRELAD
ncbi:MAG: S1 family peptidase [Roseivirga sp.]|nr:S1 family peptidase [Roseivirga sp.]